MAHTTKHLGVHLRSDLHSDVLVGADVLAQSQPRLRAGNLDPTTIPRWEDDGGFSVVVAAQPDWKDRS